MFPLIFLLIFFPIISNKIISYVVNKFRNFARKILNYILQIHRYNNKRWFSIFSKLS